MKVGFKDKINQYVDFSYAYGNDATLGFHDDKKGSSFPITLIPKSIDLYSTQKYKILFILKKNILSNTFDEIVFSIKQHLLEETYSEFPDDLREIISINTFS